MDCSIFQLRDISGCTQCDCMIGTIRIFTTRLNAYMIIIRIAIFGIGISIKFYCKTIWDSGISYATPKYPNRITFLILNNESNAICTGITRLCDLKSNLNREILSNIALFFEPDSPALIICCIRESNSLIEEFCIPNKMKHRRIGEFTDI